MAKTRKRKPSFDLPPEVPDPSGPVVETGWVYRSDSGPSTSEPAKAEPNLEGPNATRKLPAAAASARPLVVERLFEWIAMPFEIVVLMALVPFRSKPQNGR